MNSEAELIQRCKENDRAAQQVIFKKYSSKMLGICLRYSKNMEDAKDIMHDGFVKVFTTISKFRSDSALETWMTRIFINTSISHLREKSKKYNHLSIDDAYTELAEEQTSDEEKSAVEKMDKEDALALVRKLPEKYQLIINMYAVEGMSHKDIAKTLGVSEGTSKSQLSRARKMLSEMFKEINGRREAK